MVQIYNDAYRPICGAAHPASLGDLFWQTCESARPAVGAVIEKAASGLGSYIEDQRMFLERNGYLEEAFMTFSFSPIRNEADEIGGLFHPITETTDKMLAGRRTQILKVLQEKLALAKTVGEIFDVTLQSYESFDLDIPFLMIFENIHGAMEFKAQKGFSSFAGVQGLAFDLASRSPEDLVHLENHFGSLEAGPYPEASHSSHAYARSYRRSSPRHR